MSWRYSAGSGGGEALELGGHGLTGSGDCCLTLVGEGDEGGDGGSAATRLGLGLG